MKNWLFGLGRILLAALVCCFLLGGGAEAKGNQSPMEAFREAMLASNNPDTRIFRQEFSFWGPTAEAALEFMAQTADNSSMRVKGDLLFFFVDPLGNGTENSIPFYMTQSGSNMTVYFKGDKGWNKFDAPDLAAILVDAAGTPTKSELEEYMKTVKSVEILQDTDTRRTMLVHLDGKKFFQFMNSFDEKDQGKNLSEGAKQSKEAAIPYLKEGMSKADLWYTWTVDKRTWQPITVAVHLSSLVQQIAQAALNDPKATYSLPIRELLENVAYYGEAKAYTTYLNPALKSSIEIPEEALNAQPIDDLLANIPAK